MLSRIFIQNFALIDRLEIQLKSGLQVITGETGAGKSIILGALRLILGERADLKSIQNSDSKSIVEAEFKISDGLRPFFESNDLDFDADTIVRREILPSGKSRAFINDVPVTLEILKALTGQLVDIHSQFESSNLFTEEYQFRIIDGISGNLTLLRDYQKVFSETENLRSSLRRLQNRLADGNREADYKNFLLQELQEVPLDKIDFPELQTQLSMQENAGLITETLSHILARMEQEEVGALAVLNDVKNKLQKVADVSPPFSDLNRRLAEALLEIRDIAAELEAQAANVEMDPAALESLNEMNNRLNTLFLKHRTDSVAGLIELRDHLSSEQESFAHLESEISQTEESIKAKNEQLVQLAGQLSENRKKSVSLFTKQLMVLLQKLGLEKANIAVQLNPLEHFTMFGQESIQLLFQANSGFPLKPIQTVISGGERSRVMLAVKKIMAENAELPTLILDEIDTGVSGRIADEMGKVMKEMADDMQVIVITHLAQVAAKGDSNYKVVKQEIAGKTQSNILPLSDEEKLQEIAQLLSGANVTAAALQQAGELMR